VYCRLDQAQTRPTVVFTGIKEHLASGLPSMFGFTVYSSIEQATGGERPLPVPQ